ncbi:MAG TPA: SRPBCC domain-containing protein [Ohtaekwangia sp.]|nr:SRPBCC domain-containing protein [Ohtaekwangia sp.]
MKTNSLFDLMIDKTTKTVSITMVFDASLSLVWDAFTKPEILDQWYAPKPFTSKTKFMNFKVGGRRFYAMVGPDGQERWAIQEYKSISPNTNFKMFNVFADKDENPQLPGSDWDLNFSEENGADGEAVTKVHISVYNESLDRLEGLLEGFKLGMAATFENLKNVLAVLSKR